MYFRASTLRRLHCYSLVVMASFLAACSASQYAPVQELGYSSGKATIGTSVKTTPTSYQVKSGDTMFAIAWRFGWDYKKLAKANNISSPYTIYVGQKISFNDKSDNKKTTASLVSNTIKKPAINAKKLTNRAPASTPNSTASKSYSGPKDVQWNWPLQGKLLQKFSNKGSTFNGIDLSSSLGNSVKAASSGIIVYAGSGIQGYGNLVVVKHNDTFLSAYAYNSRILVVEGAAVKAGQVIAEVGKGPQLDPRLHFEIRKNGKPVNPLWYLPKQ